MFSNLWVDEITRSPVRLGARPPGALPALKGEMDRQGRLPATGGALARPWRSSSSGKAVAAPGRQWPLREGGGAVIGAPGDRLDPAWSVTPKGASGSCLSRHLARGGWLCLRRKCSADQCQGEHCGPGRGSRIPRLPSPTSVQASHRSGARYCQGAGMAPDPPGLAFRQ